MKSRKLFSVGFVSVLVVLAAVSAVVVTDTGANPSALAQSNSDEEPNDDRQNATPIETNGELISRELNNTQSTDIDFYKFDASAGQAINVYLGGSGTSPDWTLYNPSGDEIANETNGNDDTTMGGVADESGTYYLRLRNDDSGNFTDPYYGGVEVVDLDSFEPNDDFETATSIDSGEQTGTIAKGDTDVFAVEADAGTTINVSVHSAVRKSSTKGTLP